MKEIKFSGDISKFKDLDFYLFKETVKKTYPWDKWEKVKRGGKYKSFESAKKGMSRRIKQYQKRPATFHSSVGVQTREAEKLAIGTRINRIDYLVTKPKTAHPDYSKV